jgi:hypothetical protein
VEGVLEQHKLQVTSQCSLRRYNVLSVSENKYRGTRYG